MNVRPVKRVEAAILNIKEARVLQRVSEHVGDAQQTDTRARMPQISPRAETLGPLQTPPGRPRVRAKFLFIGDQKFYVRGVTYGTFKPDEDANEYPAYEVVRRDFTEMVANGINAVRTYTPPPSWL